MEHPALQGLITADWAAGCAAARYCFACASPLCVHCCGAHQQRHHGQESPAVVQIIQRVSGAPALLAESARGCGYDLTRIQRVVSGEYILISPVLHDDLRLGEHWACQSCGHRIKRGCLWCSLGCKVLIAHGGQRREAAHRLVQLAQAGLFGPPVHMRNRFCTICGLAYCSMCCPGHAHRHHAAAGADAVLTVVRVDGWAAVPADQLPAAFVHNVQALHQPDGLVLHPIHSRGDQAGHQAPALLPVLGVGGPHPCQRPECPEAFTGLQGFCSMRCRHPIP